MVRQAWTVMALVNPGFMRQTVERQHNTGSVTS